MKYIVEGGIFTSTEFKDVEPGTEERYGPFATYCQAFTAWKSAMFSPKLDICCHRVLIKEL